MINLLVSLNENYVSPLKVMLKSMFINNREKDFSIYLMHSTIPEQQIAALRQFVESEGHKLHSIPIGQDMFRHAVVLKHFTIEMYYRLVAFKFLPNDLDRILYLDPDIVVLNSVSDFYDIDFGDHYFVAAEHEYTTKMTKTFNRIRLGIPESKGYFNTGVLLMNLAKIRNEADDQPIFDFIKKNRHKLILPDQDVFNALYWDKILPVDGFRYNYDARFYDLTKRIPNAKRSIEWIKENTVFIHYCGKQKPWQPSYKGELKRFYHHYEQLLKKSPSTR